MFTHRSGGAAADPEASPPSWLQGCSGFTPGGTLVRPAGERGGAAGPLNAALKCERWINACGAPEAEGWTVLAALARRPSTAWIEGFMTPSYGSGLDGASGDSGIIINEQNRRVNCGSFHLWVPVISQCFAVFIVGVG